MTAPPTDTLRELTAALFGDTKRTIDLGKPQAVTRHVVPLEGGTVDPPALTGQQVAQEFAARLFGDPGVLGFETDLDALAQR